MDDFSQALLRWYRANRRDLPWRRSYVTASGCPDAYHVLLSEFMLQQTQVATVIPYFHRFLDRFPTIARLADASEQEVLQLWQGLGYYSRARNLQRAAKAIVQEHAGRVPDSVEALLDLPGVGRYTAGAIASIAYNLPAPIVDGNVRRVLCRIDGILADPQDRAVTARLWTRAEALIPNGAASDFSSAIMDFGATLCTPRNPQCEVCPVAGYCEASRQGLQHEIPRPKASAPRPLERRWVFCIEHEGRWLIEQRPAKGRWAGMWQFVTVTRSGRRPTAAEAAALSGVPIATLERLSTIRHELTHRRYEFAVWRCAGAATAPAAGRAWSTLPGIANYPLPKPHLQIAQQLEETC